MTDSPQIAQSLAKAEQLIADQAYEPAHALCMEVLATDAQAAGAWRLLGVLAADHDNAGKAIDFLGKAAALDLDDPRAPARLALCLMILERRDEALVQAQVAEARGPTDALTLDTLGLVFSRAGLHARAIRHFEAALALAPERADLAFNLAAARQSSGDVAGAEAAYAQALNLDPALHRAWSSRVGLRRQTAQANFRPELEAQFAAAHRSPEARLHIGHALAKTHEDLGDFEAALDWLIRAKAARRRQVGYDPRADAELFAAARATFPSATDAGRAGASGQPIFVVGMPGTGISQVMQLLLGHSHATAAGHLPHFGRILTQMAGLSGTAWLDEMTLEAAGGLDPRQVGQAYLRAVGPLAAGHERVVDATSLNFVYAGLIHRALPQARIICLRRQPMDACLATFRRLFDVDHPYFDYAYDLADTAAYYAGFERLIAHWRGVLPTDRFTEVSYEALIADPAGEGRRLLDFCGLSLDPDTRVLIEDPAIPDGSVGGWREFGAGLAPLRQGLETAGVRVDDPV